MICNFQTRERYSFDDLVRIMTLLRGEGGCPWDREQTHETIRRNLIEETYEVVEAIDERDPVLLQEELGDVLLQVVFHAEIERQSGSFDISDVVDGICKKLIRRHPHVFGEATAQTAADVLKTWDAVKSEEKGQPTVAEKLEAVPKVLPALMRSYKVGQRAAKAGYDAASDKAALEKVSEEYGALCEAVPQRDMPRVSETVGDLLLAVVNVARRLDVEPEEALTRACDRYIARVSARG